MADDADVASSYIDHMVAAALSKMQQGDAKKCGPELCEECGETIPDARRNLGFDLCIVCAERSERRGSLFAK